VRRPFSMLQYKSVAGRLQNSRKHPQTLCIPSGCTCSQIQLINKSLSAFALRRQLSQIIPYINGIQIV
jgi:hypothetical protein